MHIHISLLLTALGQNVKGFVITDNWLAFICNRNPNQKMKTLLQPLE